MASPPRSQPETDQLVASRLEPVIRAAAERIHYAEGRRSTFSGIALAMLGGGLSFFAFAFGAIDYLWLRYSAIGTSVCLIVTGMILLSMYGTQTNNYPFTAATKTWKWFYRDALPDQSKFLVGMLDCFRWGRVKQNVQTEYAQQLPGFAASVGRVSDASLSYQQDVEQLYVLHINELYKNLYLKHLRMFMNRALFVSLFIVLFLGGYGALREHLEKMDRVSNTNSATEASVVRWKLVSNPLSANWEFLADVQVTNLTRRPVTVSGLRASGDDSLPLPVDAAMVVKVPRSVPAGAAIHLRYDVKAPREVGRLIRHLGVTIEQ